MNMLKLYIIFTMFIAADLNSNLKELAIKNDLEYLHTWFIWSICVFVIIYSLTHKTKVKDL